MNGSAPPADRSSRHPGPNRGSSRRFGPKPEQVCSGEHPIVVRHDGVEVAPHGQGGCEVDGVERSQDPRIEHRRRVEDPVIDEDEVDSPKGLTDAGERLGS